MDNDIYILILILLFLCLGDEQHDAGLADPAHGEPGVAAHLGHGGSHPTRHPPLHHPLHRDRDMPAHRHGEDQGEVMMTEFFKNR